MNNDRESLHEAEAPDRENDVAIIGMALRVPGADTLSQFWQNLCSGTESIADLTEKSLLSAGVSQALLDDPRYVRRAPMMNDVPGFDAGFFDFSPLDAQMMDPQHRHFLELCWETFEHAGYDPFDFAGAIGVFAGSGHNAYMPYNLLTNRDLMQRAGFFLVRHTGNDKDFLATRVSYEFNLRGPSINVQTACSTSLVGIHLAIQSLLNGESDMALAGGITIEMPPGRGYLHKEGEILAPDGHCRPFDEASSGTLFGSGGGVVLLKRYDDAVADGDSIHAIIRGSAVNNDGAGKVSYMAPSVDGQAAAIHEALMVADVDPGTIDYIECHGTGTPIGDPIEIAALTQAYRASGSLENQYCAIGSVKSNIGHLDTAAGIVGLIKAVLSLEARQLPPSLNYSAPNPSIQFANSPFFVNSALCAWDRRGDARRAAVSSLGVGGTNAHVILEEAPAREPSYDSAQTYLMVLSAKTDSALKTMMQRCEDYLRDHQEVSLSDAAYTLRYGRRKFSQCGFQVLDAQRNNLLSQSLEADQTPRDVVFMFAGGGAQYPNMGKDLYDQEPVFRDSVNECLDVIAQFIDFDLRALLYPGNDEQAIKQAAKELQRPSRSVTSLFIMQYAQVKLWQSWGINPSGLIGHSLGENTAACVSGVLSLKDALGLVALRGQLFEQVESGGMLSVNLSEASIKERLPTGLDLACVNGTELTTVSGPTDLLNAFQEQLEKDDIPVQRIRINIAAHSAMLDGILAPFGDYLRSIKLNAPTIPFISNVTGQWIASERASDPDYWVEHLRSTVRFSDGIATLCEKGAQVFLEVGPGQALTSLASTHPKLTAAQRVVSSMRKHDEACHDVATMLIAMGALWAFNALDEQTGWQHFADDTDLQRIPMPTYPFEHQRYWVDSGEALALESSDLPMAAGLPKRLDAQDWLYQPVWQPLSALDVVGYKEPVPLLWLGAVDQQIELLRQKLLPLIVEAEDLSSGFQMAATSQNTLKIVLTILFDAESAFHDPARAQLLYFEQLFVLFEQIQRLEGGAAVDCVVITRSGSAMTSSHTNPWLSMTEGLLKVVSTECPNVSCRLLDCAQSVDAEQLAQEVLFGQEPFVALNAAQRWSRRFVKKDRIPETTQVLPQGLEPLLRRISQQDQVVLVTGALGGLGKLFLEHFVAVANQPLQFALLGRRGLPSRSDWHRMIEEQHPLATQLEWILRLEERGARCVVYGVDISDQAPMTRVINEIHAHQGAVGAVVHAAGVLDDQLLGLKTLAAARDVLAPKVAGTINLQKLLSNDPLSLFVCFSSISALAGLPGQMDYAAANGFLDGFAQWRNLQASSTPTLDRMDHEKLKQRTPRCYTVSLAWPAWRDLGMAQRLAQGVREDWFQGEAVDHPWLDLLLECDDSRALYATQFSVEKHWLLDEHRLANGQALIPATGYLELIRAAVAMLPNREHRDETLGAIELEDVLFLTPFAVAQGEQRWLKIRLEKLDGVLLSEGWIDFSVESLNPEDGDVLQHAVGRVRCPADDLHFSIDSVDLSETSKRCTRRVQRFDDSDHHPFLQFGDRWASLQAVELGDKEALSSLDLGEFSEDLTHIKLHPAIMDMGIAGAQAILPDVNFNDVLYVPVGISRVRFSGAAQIKSRSWVRLVEADKADNEDAGSGEPAVAVYDALLTDLDGGVYVEVEGLTLQKVDDLETVMRALSGEMAATQHDGLDRALSLGISSGEGLQQFDRILHDSLMQSDHGVEHPMMLSDRAADQVVIAPVGFDRLIEALNPRKSDRAGSAGANNEAQLAKISAIETELKGHEHIDEVVVKSYIDDAGEMCFTAHYSVVFGKMLTVSDLRDFALAGLNSALVPTHFFEEDYFERLPDGSIDRMKIVDPFAQAQTNVEPRNPVERMLVNLWCELLGLDQVSITDNFYDAGGHSLLAIRVITRIDKQYGVRLNQAIIALQTLEQVAQLIVDEAGIDLEAHSVEGAQEIDGRGANDKEAMTSGSSSTVTYEAMMPPVASFVRKTVDGASHKPLDRGNEINETNNTAVQPEGRRSKSKKLLKAFFGKKES